MDPAAAFPESSSHVLLARPQLEALGPWGPAASLSCCGWRRDSRSSSNGRSGSGSRGSMGAAHVHTPSTCVSPINLTSRAVQFKPLFSTGAGRTAAATGHRPIHPACLHPASGHMHTHAAQVHQRLSWHERCAARRLHAPLHPSPGWLNSCTQLAQMDLPPAPNWLNSS
jgi:hypothetical protein